MKNKRKKTAVEYENFPSITEYEHVELPDVLYKNEAAFEYEELTIDRTGSHGSQNMPVTSHEQGSNLQNALSESGQKRINVEDAIINQMKVTKQFLQHRKYMNGTTNIQTHTAIPYTDEMRHGVWNRDQDNTSEDNARHLNYRHDKEMFERNNVPFTSAPIINTTTVPSKPTNMKFDLNKNKTSHSYNILDPAVTGFDRSHNSNVEIEAAHSYNTQNPRVGDPDRNLKRNIFSNTSHLKYNDYESEGNKDADYIINNYSKIEETNASDLTIIGQPEDEYDCTKRRLGSENDGQLYNETVDNVYNTSEYHKDVDRNEDEYDHVFLK